jgi:hypothetical protein
LTACEGLSQADADEIWAAHGTEIEVINQVAHLCMTQPPAMRKATFFNQTFLIEQKNKSYFSGY